MTPRNPLRGVRTLLYKEVLRFWKVGFQTVAAPVLTAVMYLLIFGHVLSDKVQVFDNVGYTRFLIPGLVMMSVLQNAFANSSSSLVQSKITGNLVFLLVTPLSHWAWFTAYVGASMVRGLSVGLGVFAVTAWFAPPGLAQPLWIVVFAVLGAGMLGALGLIAGLWADKFDQMAAFQNFIIMPMTFLSGVFYSVHSLPEFWNRIRPEPVLLHDRRLSPRLLRCQRRLALAQPGRGRRQLPGGVDHRAVAAEDRLQAAPLSPLGWYRKASVGRRSAWHEPSDRAEPRR
jgi:ABC-2 type transport system permease protein